MPRLLSRMPPSLHKPASIALVGLGAVCFLVAILLFVQFSQTTETSGHLWWKETREIPLDERRPYLIVGICLSRDVQCRRRGGIVCRSSKEDRIGPTNRSLFEYFVAVSVHACHSQKLTTPTSAPS